LSRLHPRMAPQESGRTASRLDDKVSLPLQRLPFLQRRAGSELVPPGLCRGEGELTFWVGKGVPALDEGVVVGSVEIDVDGAARRGVNGRKRM
jgi:hypothetical protein